MGEIRYLVSSATAASGCGSGPRRLRSVTRSTTAASATASCGSNSRHRRQGSAGRGPSWTRPKERLSGRADRAYRDDGPAWWCGVPGASLARRS